MTNSKQTRILILTIAGLCFITILFLIPETSGETYTVDDDGGANYTKIQDALDNAEAGDTILVSPGTYHEDIAVRKTLDVIGSGPEDCIIQGNGDKEVVYIGGGHVNFSGFSIISSGTGENKYSMRVGSDRNSISEVWMIDGANGVWFGNGDNNTFRNNIMQNLSTYGIFIDQCDGNVFANNTIHGNKGYGITFSYRCNNNVVENNTITENDYGGINLHMGENYLLKDNICNGNKNYGISMGHVSEEVTVINNECSGNTKDGIIVDVMDCTVIGNTVSNNGRIGIKIFNGGDRSTVRDNIVSNNAVYGIWMDGVQSCMLTGNELLLNDFGIEGDLALDWESHFIDATNTLDGKPIYYLNHQIGGIVPMDAGKVILVACHDVTVQDLVFTSLRTPITIAFSQRIIVNNNSCTNNAIFGIGIIQSSHCRISNNTCTGNSGKVSEGGGIYLQSSWFNTIQGNTCSGNEYCGITLNNWCFNNTILNNTIEGNGKYGIYCTYARGTVVENNSIVKNDLGMYVTFWSDNISVMHNVFQGNSKYGISVQNNNEETVMAINNWWGDDSGPYHPTNSGGKGDNVTDLVIFEPWTRNNEPPVVWISLPWNDSLVAGVVDITGGALDDEGTLELVEISIDNGDWITITPSISWNFSWDTTTLENDEHTIRVRAFDGTYHSEIVTYTYTVDNEPIENGGEEGFIPGFEIISTIASLLVLVMVSRRLRVPGFDHR